jgi:phenylpropionate dioxygenase-like ring-hydroxylating dioxygenase large terminal subunit
MEETKNFDKAGHGLIPIRLETWAGFMFINPGETGPSLLEWLDDLPELTASYGLEDWACTRRREYELACNWKIIIENFNDEAHIRTVHPKTLLDISEKYAAPAIYEHGDGYWVGSYCEHEGTRLLVGGVDGPPGFDPVPTLKGRVKNGSYHPTVYPHVCFGFCIDGGWALEVYPLAPDRTKLVVNSFFHKNALKRADFASVVQRYYDRLDVSTDEDNAIEEAVQRGLASPQAKPGRLSQDEIGINWLHNWWLDQIFGVTTESHKPDGVRADARAA